MAWRIVLITLFSLFSVSLSLAQETPESTETPEAEIIVDQTDIFLEAALTSLKVQDSTLIDHTFEGYKVTVPYAWMVYRRADYASQTEASVAFQQLLEGINNGAPVNPLMLAFTSFSAIQPPAAESADPLVQMLVVEYPYDDILAHLDTEESALNAALVYGLFDAGDPLNTPAAEAADDTQEGETDAEAADPQDIAFGRRDGDITEWLALYHYPEQRLFMAVSLVAPQTNNNATQALYAAILASLRKADEPYNVAQWQAIAQTDAAFSFNDPIAYTDIAAKRDQLQFAAQNPDLAAIECQVISNQNANLRSGPGTNNAAVAILNANVYTDAIGQATGADGFVWWQLAENQWVRSDIVVERGDCDLLPTVEIP